MPRTVAEIDADLAALKASGSHPASREMKALRTEKAALSAPPVTETLPPDVSVECAMAASDPYQSDEWAFIKQAIASTEIEFKSGQMTGVAKKMFNILGMKLLLWRTARDIVAEVGIGGEWPSWSTLGRDESTGRKEAPKPVTPPVSSPSATVGITEGGMPIHASGPAPSELDAYKQSILASIGGQIGTRAEPARAAVPV